MKTRYDKLLLLILLVWLLAACAATPDAPAPAAGNTSAEAEAPEAEAPEAEAPEGAEAVVEATAESAEEPELTPLKVVTLPFISFAPFYIGVEEGHFAAEGLAVELVNMTVQREVVPALASGQVDVASGLVTAGVLNAIARGGELKFVADKGYIAPDACDSYAIIARKELVETIDFNTTEAWQGRNADVVPATWLEYYLDKALVEVGASIDDVVQTDLPAPSEPEALAQGGIDVTVNNEPWVTIHGRSGHLPVLTPVSQLLPESQSAVIFYGPNLLQNRELGERFMRAYLQAVQQYNEGATERNLEILLKYVQIDPALLENMCWPALRDDGTVNMDSVLDFQAWAVARGIMEAALTADQIYDAGFLEASQ